MGHRRTRAIPVLVASLVLAATGVAMPSTSSAATLPTRWVGTGTASSCTSARVVAAIRRGGIIRFRCGRSPVVIRMHATAKVFNDRPDLVIDGGGKVTLDGGGTRRILYLNTCDPALVWTTSHCQDQAHPTLSLRNITFRNGRSTGSDVMDGGGAVFVRGGRLSIHNTRFFGNRCASTGPDVGGGALQVFSQYHGRAVPIDRSVFGGDGWKANRCSNGGAIASIGVSWTISDSVFQYNRATGTGANPPRNGLPGGGNGGAIYNDGNTMTLRLTRTRLTRNHSNGEGGSAIFFVSNDRSGDVVIRDSTFRYNAGSTFDNRPDTFFLGAGWTFSGNSVR
jgi:hypothetical protein